MTTTASRRAILRDRSAVRSTDAAPRMGRAVRDRFDDVPDGAGRVGAHRGPRRRGRGWIVLAWAALAVGVIVGGGVLALLPLFPESDTAPTAGGRTAEQAAPVTDPAKVDPSLGLEITVLNASSDAGADSSLGERLTAKGWPVNGTADASTRDESSTVVYYDSRALEGVARGLVKTLGTGTVQLSDAFPGAPVTIVIGSDYTP